MEKTLEFVKVSPRQKVSTVVLSNKRRFTDSGQEGKKYFVDVRVNNSGKSRATPAPLVLKEIHWFATSIDQLRKNYLELKQVFIEEKVADALGYLPLPTTYRTDKYSVLISDLSEGGVNLVIDKHINGLDLEEAKITNTEEMIKQMEWIAGVAESHNIYLSHDSYAFVVNKSTGKGRTFLLDLGSVKPFGSEKEDLSLMHRGNVKRMTDFIRTRSRKHL